MRVNSAGFGIEAQTALRNVVSIRADASELRGESEKSTCIHDCRVSIRADASELLEAVDHERGLCSSRAVSIRADASELRGAQGSELGTEGLRFNSR